MVKERKKKGDSNKLSDKDEDKHKYLRCYLYCLKVCEQGQDGTNMGG